ncbi:zinc finger protein [Macleaya cordata]|uniref:Zinc finger protein n=1 Tax=Macleaya cordata TaxID=56857 RepID=A0A200QA06_MACCD|nr:zinc finger protein [Macleaya cordata]
MEDFNFSVGQEFSDVKTFRKAIKEAAIAQHFELRIIKSDLIRYFAKCATEGCPWRIRAVKLPNVPTFTIRSLEGTHTCGKNAQNGHHQASVDWIVNFIEERLRDNMNYKPKDILQDIHKQYGITIPYKQAWRAKERGLAAIYGSSEEGYCLLPAYCEQIKKTNPGSVAQLTFLSDGQKGIVDAVKRKFPSAFHGYCMRHLTESVGKEFKNSRLVHLLWKAAYSITTIGFKEKMAEIEEVSAEAAKWIQEISPSRWALPYFEGTRFGHLSSNIEEFNKWIFEARELPIIQVIERIHSKLMAEFDERRSKSLVWMSILAPSAEKRISEAIARASSYQVLRSDEVEFEVLSAERSHIVNIGTRSCSCRDWQLYGLPCSHAVAALLSCRKDVYEFSERCFTVSSYRATYSQVIHPIPDKSEWSKESEAPMDEDSRVVRPPKFRRPPGRPEKKRLCVEDLNREKHTVHCSRCNQTGHYKTTCKADIIKSIEQF